jgi:hypothetical protein
VRAVGGTGNPIQVQQGFVRHGNINDVVNEYLLRTPFGRSLPDSPAGNLLDKYGNNTFAKGWLTNKSKWVASLE